LKQLISISASDEETGEIVNIGEVQSVRSMDILNSIFKYEFEFIRSIRINSLCFAYIDTYISSQFYTSLLYFWFENIQYKPNPGILFGSKPRKLHENATYLNKVRNLNKEMILNSFSVYIEHPLLHSTYIYDKNDMYNLDSTQLWYMLRYK